MIASIIPDDEMPYITEFDGEELDDNSPIKKRVDLLHNNMGIINRGNPSALVEMELNHISRTIRHRMNKMNNIEEQKEYLLGYAKDVDKVSYDAYSKMFRQLDENETKEALQDFIENGIPLRQAPFFDNIEINQLRDIFNKYDIKKNKLNVSNRTFMVGELYHMKLKHEPVGKLSAKSLDFNNYSNLPVRTPDSKQYKSTINNNPIRLGKHFAA